MSELTREPVPVPVSGPVPVPAAAEPICVPAPAPETVTPPAPAPASPLPAELPELPDQRAVFRRAAFFLRGHRVALAATVSLNLSGAALAVGTTAAVGRVVDAASAGDRAGLVQRVLTLLALVLVSGVVTWLARYWLIRTGERVLAGIRERAVSAVGAAPLRFLEAQRGGELLRRLTGELNGLASFVGGTLPDLVTAVSVLGFTVVVLALYSWPLTLVLLVAFVPPALVVTGRFHRRAGRVYARTAAAEAAVAARFAESLPAQEQLRLTGGVPRRLKRFASDNEDLLAARTSQVRTELGLNQLALVQAVALGGLLVLGAVLVGRGALSVGVAVVFVLAAREVFHRFEDLAGAVGDAREAHVRLARLLDLVRAASSNDGPSTAIRGESVEVPGRGSLTVSGLTFSYPSGGDRPPVVRDLDLIVPAGDRLVIVGETGSGKSTLGKLLAGLYVPDHGTVAFAGRELTSLPTRLLRSRIVLVPQEVVLVNGTLADNLAMVAGEPDRACIEAAVARLGLSRWVDSLPQGLDTPIGTRALSAGERQLVALVRAALADPAVLILDEATAGVDHTTAARIEEALSASAADRTLIVIAHRADTIARGHRTLSMPAGRIADVIRQRA